MRRLFLLCVVGMAMAPGAAKAWSWPTDGAVLRTFSFDRSHPYAAGQHRGIDVAGSAGSDVVAVASGTVSFSGTVPTSGKVVTIETSDGYSVTLTHLGSISVKKGAAVQRRCRRRHHRPERDAGAGRAVHASRSARVYRRAGLRRSLGTAAGTRGRQRRRAPTLGQEAPRRLRRQPRQGPRPLPIHLLRMGTVPPARSPRRAARPRRPVGAVRVRRQRTLAPLPLGRDPIRLRLPAHRMPADVTAPPAVTSPSRAQHRFSAAAHHDFAERPVILHFTRHRRHRAWSRARTVARPARTPAARQRPASRDVLALEACRWGSVADRRCFCANPSRRRDCREGTACRRSPGTQWRGVDGDRARGTLAAHSAGAATSPKRAFPMALLLVGLFALGLVAWVARRRRAGPDPWGSRAADPYHLRRCAST